MIGVPRTCKTKQDYLNIYQAAKNGKLPSDEVLKSLRGLLGTKDCYVLDRILGDSEEPDGTPPEYTVTETVQEDSTTERRQNKLTENPKGRIFKLGFTVSAVQQMISDLEG